jgi:hypothetical protein
MSSTATSPGPAQAISDQKEIRIVQHSGIFYWWPVWASGFIMALITLIGGHVLAIVPAHSSAERNQEIKGVSGPRHVIIAPDGKSLPTEPDSDVLLKPERRMANSSTPGVLWAIILLLVIVITNVPLRGLWSVVVIVVIVLLSVIFALAGWWEHILHSLALLDIRINMGGYLFISSVLLIIWLVTVSVFDKQIYMVFTPGQLRVCQEIGGGETAYDTQGMVIQKQRDDLFRHWILGLGSGDLIVRTAGAHQHEFHLNNVLFVGHKLKQIEEMQRDRPVVRGG